MEHSMTFSDFIDKLPKEAASLLGQIETARIFLWFAKKIYIISSCKIQEIEDSFIEAGWNKPSGLISRLRKDYEIISLPSGEFSLTREGFDRLEGKYSKYLEFNILAPTELEKQLKITPPPLLSKDEISDAFEMARAYVYLYFVEVSARQWVNSFMTMTFGNKWWESIDSNQKIMPKHKDRISEIKDKVKVNKAAEAKNKLMDNRKDIMQYLEWADLISLIEINCHYLPSGTEKKLYQQIKSCLEELRDLRTRVAHNCVINAQHMSMLEIDYSKWCKFINP